MGGPTKTKKPTPAKKRKPPKPKIKWTPEPDPTFLGLEQFLATGPGRPRKQIDLYMLEKLAFVHLPNIDIAYCLGISKKTFERRKKMAAVAEALDRGRARGRGRLLVRQMEIALAGHPTMLIWMGKQVLGQKDIVTNEHRGSGQPPIDPSDARARLADLFDRRAAARPAPESVGEVE
jgi:hypothetical protein